MLAPIRTRKTPQKLEAAEALLAARPAPEGEARWAREARAAAEARLREMGAPARRDEYWKYTDPAPLLQPAPDAAPAMADDEGPLWAGTDALRLVFVDGVFRPDLSDDPRMEGVEIAPLSEALAADIHWAADLFGRLEAEGQSQVERPLAALNTACAAQGFAIRATGKAARPIDLRYVHEDPRADAMVRNLVRLEPGAELTLLEEGAVAARANMCLEVSLAEGARLHHVRAQGRDHERVGAAHIFALLDAEASFKSFTLTANGRLTRNETVVRLAGDGASAHLAGACVGDGAFLHDDTVFITHDAVGCESRQVFKKVLREGARGVFQGKILVRPGAQKTDGYQLSQGLLLTENAEFDSKPELEIYADDVACSHGSTVGAVDETALFYLRSRGIPADAARNMLVLAFLDEAVAEIEDEALADVVRARVAAWLERRSR
ncbi:Fe-S cluster assembly protein SufD [Oceanicella actignis]|uniref:Fe-S cluster assembly protein SufD n=1 Tax=Oceanicella actignis TaxID=1189325 RepID=UPI0011E66160|nr:Fe-S cluster assembly protein SufD [Oceanicella actignis]TYO88486.1 Fe-S cluster assembly protein SufD [Oceanicella actignis]